VKKEILAPIITACEQAGVVVKACEPPSFAMARMASKVHEPFILVYPLVKPEFVCAIRDGKVLEVVRVDPLGVLEETKRTCIAYVAKMWGIPVRAIATNMPDPVVGLASKTEFTGVDMDVLNIPTENEEKEIKRLPLPAIIALIAILVVAIVLFSVRLWNSSSGKVPLSTTASSQIIPTPTETPVVRTDLKIEVQNGSGVAGLASKGKKVLEDAGYTTVTTANADNYDYVGVTVKGKTTAVSVFVVSDINTSYPSASASSTLLDNTSPVDAIVILGKE
jgi:surface antigen